MSDRVQIVSSNYLEAAFDVRCEFVNALQDTGLEGRSICFLTPFRRSFKWTLRYRNTKQIFGSFKPGPNGKSCTDIQLSSSIGNRILCDEQIASTKHMMFTTKYLASQGTLKGVKYFSTDLKLNETCDIDRAGDLYTQDGHLVVRIRIRFENYVHRPEKATLWKLYNSINNRLCDFEIVTNGGSLRVFRSILCLKWPYFDAMMSAHYLESLNNVCTIDDISYETMKHIILYVYCDTVTLDDKDRVIDILRAAHRYELKSLVEACANYLLFDIDFEDALKVFVISDLYDLVELKVKCSDLISEAIVGMEMKDLPGYEEFSKHPDVLRLTHDCFRLSSKLLRLKPPIKFGNPIVDFSSQLF
ncbi:Protein maternal effect lethal 26 [Halotydeus destructor]|nr:Protein maternal effect lethal 26 [Halotydeus destructor]